MAYHSSTGAADINVNPNNNRGPASLTAANLAVHEAQSSSATTDPKPMQRWWSETNDRLVQGRAIQRPNNTVDKDELAKEIERIVQEANDKNEDKK